MLTFTYQHPASLLSSPSPLVFVALAANVSFQRLGTGGHPTTCALAARGAPAAASATPFSSPFTPPAASSAAASRFPESANPRLAPPLGGAGPRVSAASTCSASARRPGDSDPGSPRRSARCGPAASPAAGEEEDEQDDEEAAAPRPM
uniref:Uncharacterized protein n=1 Tax=Arundo donax TaxID=35708 RepID=A0A0A9HJB9_ARUDO